MNNIFIPAAMLTTLLGVGALHGEWTLISDFESNLEGWDITYNRGGHGTMVHADDPLNAENKVFYLESGGYGVSDANTNFASYTVPAINPGETATLYFRYYEVGPSNTFAMCLSATPKEQDGDGNWNQPASFGQLETIWRVGTFDVPSETGVRDANRYPRVGVGDTPESFVPTVHQSGTWYEVWMVVRNDTDPFEDNYSVYIKGGQYEEQTLLNVEQIGYNDGELTGDYPTSAYFRNGTENPLITLVMFTESGFAVGPLAGDHWYTDDIYLAPGEELSSPDSPTPEKWGPYDVVNNSVDTGSWLGSLYVMHAPWVWSYSLEGWLYITEDAAMNESGAWIYAARIGS